MRSWTRLLLLLLWLTLPPVRLDAQPAAPLEGKLVSLTLRYEITPKLGTRRVTLTVLIPQTLPGNQKILKITYSVEPEKVYDLDGNRYARFVLEQPQKTTIAIDVEAEIYRRDLASAKALGKPEAEKDLAPWLKDETYLETNAPEIRAAAQRLAGKTEEETVRNVMRFVTTSLRRGPYDDADHGAVWALQKKRGDCTEFADLFVTLCRANDLPARWCDGYLTVPPGPGETPKHDRAEVYLKEYGWVPFDPFHVLLGSATVETLRPVFLALDRHRRNPELKNFHYFTYRYEGDSIRVTDSFVLRRQTDLKGK